MTWLKRNWPIVLCVLVAFLWGALYVLWRYFGDHSIKTLPPAPLLEDLSFLTFNNKFGSVLGIISTIIVGFLAALIPSKVESQVNEIAERLQQPLESFEAIYERTLELLIWVKNEPRSRFIMTCATPVFGIELDESKRLRWQNALQSRITSEYSTDFPVTELLCLNPDALEGLGHSALWGFCKELEASGLLKNTEVRNASDLYRRSMAAFADFAKSFASKNGFGMRCGQQPPLHFVLAENSRGERKGILYFTGIQTTPGLVVSGFSTKDERWLKLIEQVHKFLSQETWDALKAFKTDRRTDEQRERCNELLEYQLQAKHRVPYFVTVGGYEVEVDPDVFPPEKGIGTESLLEAIKLIRNSLNSIYSHRRCVGIDVGTGTGILSLALAEFCKQVYATDISLIAARNAEINLGKCDNVKIYNCNLLDNIPKVPQEDFAILAFNYPFYPSPLAVYNSAGRGRAGISIVREFFERLDRVVVGESILLMPYSPIADDPTSVARENGYSTTSIVKMKNGGCIYAFTKSEKIRALLPTA